MLITNEKVTERYARRHRAFVRPLERWTNRVESATWRTPQEAEMSSNSVRHIGQGLLAFNVQRNRYRIVAFVNYENQWLEVIFVGTHREYDRAMKTGVWT